MTDKPLVAPFPYFGGKRKVAAYVWSRLGTPKQYIEPFCGSAAMLLAAPKPASLEVVCDMNGYIANFWRAVKHQPDKVAGWADYPVSHIDMGARHKWLREQRNRLGQELLECDWPGDAKVAGWWLWGQCAWIGSGWCDVDRKAPEGVGQVPLLGNAGRGIQAIGQGPRITDAGCGYQATSHANTPGPDHLLTSGGRAAWVWLHKLAARLDRVRVIHGDWKRCLNHHYGTYGTMNCAVFLDPPYLKYGSLYGEETPVAKEAEAWAKEHPHLRIALCGHIGDYDLPGWETWNWSRGRMTMGSSKTTDQECIWFSPACHPSTVDVSDEPQPTDQPSLL